MSTSDTGCLTVCTWCGAVAANLRLLGSRLDLHWAFTLRILHASHWNLLDEKRREVGIDDLPLEEPTTVDSVSPGLFLWLLATWWLVVEMKLQSERKGNSLPRGRGPDHPNTNMDHGNLAACSPWRYEILEMDNMNDEYSRLIWKKIETRLELAHHSPLVTPSSILYPMDRLHEWTL